MNNRKEVARLCRMQANLINTQALLFAKLAREVEDNEDMDAEELIKTVEEISQNQVEKAIKANGDRFIKAVLSWMVLGD